MEYIRVPKEMSLTEMKKTQAHYDSIEKGKYLVIKDTFSVESSKDKGNLLLG